MTSADHDNTTSDSQVCTATARYFIVWNEDTVVFWKQQKLWHSVTPCRHVYERVQLTLVLWRQLLTDILPMRSAWHSSIWYKRYYSTVCLLRQRSSCLNSSVKSCPISEGCVGLCLCSNINVVANLALLLLFHYTELMFLHGNVKSIW